MPKLLSQREIPGAVVPSKLEGTSFRKPFSRRVGGETVTPSTECLVWSLPAVYGPVLTERMFRKLPRLPILKEINPDCPLKGRYWNSNNLGREDLLEKTLILGKIEGKERRGQLRMRWLDSLIDATNMSLSRLWERVEDMGPWCDAVHGVTKSPAWLSNWTTTQLAWRTWLLQSKMFWWWTQGWCFFPFVSCLMRVTAGNLQISWKEHLQITWLNSF